MVGPFIMLVNGTVFLMAVYTLVSDTIPNAVNDLQETRSL